MFCIVALVVLSILGIFSASNRQLAKEALDCVFRRVTFRPCITGFDVKMKSKILGSVINRSETAARFLNKNFELLSWIFFILLLGSSIWTVRGGYLFYTTGSCNGINSEAFCVFDPSGANNQVSAISATCRVPTGKSNNGLTLDGVDTSGWPVKNPGAKDKIVFIGCYGCDYSRKAYPIIRDLVAKYNVELVFNEYPTKLPTNYLSKIGLCVYKEDQEKYWKLNDTLFVTDKTELVDEAAIQKILVGLGLDAAKITACAADPQTEDTSRHMIDEIGKTNIYGTPTIFINGKPMVGPKPYRVYAIALKGLFYWLK
jgi:predicted DsbA family dithiol-disulfide isomerase